MTYSFGSFHTAKRLRRSRGCFVFMVMAKDFSAEFYNSTAWRNIRETVLRRDRYLCVECLKRGIYSPAWTVHHIEHLTADNVSNPNVTLNPKNLESVCLNCHATIHAGDKANGRKVFYDKRNSARKKRYRVDANGDVLV